MGGSEPVPNGVAKSLHGSRPERPRAGRSAEALRRSLPLPLHVRRHRFTRRMGCGNSKQQRAVTPAELATRTLMLSQSRVPPQGPNPSLLSCSKRPAFASLVRQGRRCSQSNALLGALLCPGAAPADVLKWLDDPVLTAEPVAPPLDAANAATRFVFVPASEFGSEGIGGWIAKITSVAKGKKQVTTMAFKDADGRQETQHFEFEHVRVAFKPLS